MGQRDYPWYDVVTGDVLEQGDLFEQCPVLSPPAGLKLEAGGIPAATIDWRTRDVILLSQSCDMVRGQEKLSDVLLCSVWNPKELDAGPFKNLKSGLENVRCGRVNGFHLLANCTLPGLQRNFRVVDFRRVYSLPLEFMRSLAAAQGSRLRLLPPYREHLSQAFARFFMRVGLPVDIPPFK
ncbi:MAG: hypothetical protein ABSE73_31300 [Planctomycetota bacterium]